VTLGPTNSAAASKPATPDRGTFSVIVRIGVIVALAIACVIVAVLSSAERADQVALDQQRQLFMRAISDHGERMLREVESITASDRAVRNIREARDLEWVRQRIGQWLETFYDHQLVFVVDAEDHFINAPVNVAGVGDGQLASAHKDLLPLLAYLRGRKPHLPNGARTILASDAGTNLGHGARVALVQNLIGHPTLIVASEITLPDQPQHAAAPFVIAVKYLDGALLNTISNQLLLPNLRTLDQWQQTLPRDYVFDLSDDQGATLARFAWTPKQPGSQVVRSVLPFVAFAIVGFAVLAAFVLRYMLRTAATIAAGEERMRHLAMHDPLCGLPNRVFFGERLEATIEEVRAGGRAGAVFYIDLDHFKDVNDTLGHPVGDELIRNVTLRLNKILRGDDLVARLGGDEFAVITTSGTDIYLLQGIAGRIISSLSAPYSVNGQNIVIGASVGIAVIDPQATSAAEIMRYADIALYRAKNEGRRRACIYDAEMDHHVSGRKQLEHDLREAIENGGLSLAYQPIVNNSGETLVGVEALCRWRHPDRGDIPPTEFIPVAEESGLITALGEWVLRRACLDGQAWPGLLVAVNVSPLQFRRTDFVELVERILSETRFDSSRLELEVTESTFLGNVSSAEAAMVSLKNLGVRLALDDFGTGYSSLLYLRRFPFDKLKIDRSFVSSIEKAADAAAIVHAIVSLGRGLGMKVAAEGVETAEQQLFLRAAGVHVMQGFYFGKAMSAAALSRRLAGTFRRGASDIAAAG